MDYIKKAFPPNDNTKKPARRTLYFNPWSCLQLIAKNENTYQKKAKKETKKANHLWNVVLRGHAYILQTDLISLGDQIAHD